MLGPAVAEATLFGVVAALSSVLGAALAILSHVSGARTAARQAEQDCHERLLVAQREAEQLSGELHQLRMSISRPGMQP